MKLKMCDYYACLRPDELAYLYFLRDKEQLRNHWIRNDETSSEEVFSKIMY